MYKNFLALAISGVLVLLFRNLDPIMNPSLYGEDAKWFSFSFRYDLWGSFVHTRYDYLTAGQSILLQIAFVTNTVVAGNNVSHLPQIAAALSYLLWSMTAALSFVTLTPWLPRSARLVLTASILLVPLGGHTNEIVGRVLNLGFMFFPLSAFLMVLRPQLVALSAKYTVDLLLLVCCATNPLCIPLTLAYIAVSAAVRVQSGIKPVREIAVMGAIGALCLFYAFRFATAPSVDLGTFNVAGLIEALGRSILYSFVFPFYTQMNDAWTLIGLAGVAALVITALVRSRGDDRVFGLSLLFATGLVVVGTLATRPGLTSWLEGYTSTFPDRYYYAQNIMSVLLCLWSVSMISVWARRLFCAAMTVVYVIGAPALFEFDQPRMPIAVKGTFGSAVSAVWAANPGALPSAMLVVPAYPEGWSTTITGAQAEATAANAPYGPSGGIGTRLRSLLWAFLGLLPLLIPFAGAWALGKRTRRRALPPRTADPSAA